MARTAAENSVNCAGTSTWNLERENVSATMERLPRLLVAWVATAFAIFLVLVVWQAQSVTAADESVVVAKRDDLVVSVTGVGRIAEANAAGSVVLAAGSAAASSSSGSTPSGSASASGASARGRS